jgi:excisionase family DNA binding protein
MRLEKFLTSFGAAKVLNLSVERIRQLERAGKLRATRAGGGRFRLFKRVDVERLAMARRAVAEAKNCGESTERKLAG